MELYLYIHEVKKKMNFDVCFYITMSLLCDWYTVFIWTWKKNQISSLFSCIYFTVLIKIYKIISKSKILQLEGGERLLCTHTTPLSPRMIVISVFTNNAFYIWYLNLYHWVYPVLGLSYDLTWLHSKRDLLISCWCNRPYTCIWTENVLTYYIRI